MLDESAQSMPKVCVAGPAKVPSLLNVTYVLSPCVIASPLSSVETVSFQVAPSGFRSAVTWELPTATCLRSDRLTRMVLSLASPFQSTPISASAGDVRLPSPSNVSATGPPWIVPSGVLVVRRQLFAEVRGSVRLEERREGKRWVSA